MAAIILAAGASSRLGRPKQLLLLHGETLVERVERLAAEAGASPVITVLGAHLSKIFAAIAPGKSIRVHNETWEQGIASSIHAGLNALDSCTIGANGVLITTCDQPRLNADHLRGLIAAFASSSQLSIAASSYAGKLGVPAIFPQAVFAHLHDLRGDIGARALLLHPPCPIITVPFAGGEIDIDSPADLAQLE